MWGGRWERRARSASSALAVVVVLVLAAVVSPPGAGALPTGWTDCLAMLGARPAADAQCTTVAVPIDYARPDAGQVHLAVLRIPATGARVGTLLVNPGGPGVSAVDTVASMAAGLANTPITERFDLVGFDPRGVGHSEPPVRCRTDAEIDAYRRLPMVDYSLAGVAAIETQLQTVARQCAQRTGSAVLANIGTAAAAQDMDAVRAVLGDEQLNYLGFSYGTQLGAAYASRYGDRVRAMVLDGAVDPATPPIQDNLEQLAGFQTAFDDYAADCARSPDCPLGTDPAGFVARYRALVDPLVTRPGKTSDPRGLSYADAITGTADALYAPRLWKYLTSGLLGLRRGTDAGDLLALADDYWRRDSAGHYSNQQDAFLAVRCNDAPYPTDPAVWAAADLAARQAAPFMSYGQYTGRAPRDICALWPVPPTSTPRAAVSPGAGKVLVVSTTHDPATPYQNGVDLAGELGGALLTFDGTQHTVVFTGQPCVDPAVLAFLIDGVSPAAGTTCGTSDQARVTQN